MEGHVIDDSIKKDPETEKVVEYYMKDFEAKLDLVVGHTIANIDGRFDRIRKEETNLGNPTS